jgi:hypothetical protein
MSDDAAKQTDDANVVAFVNPPKPQAQGDHVKRERTFLDTTRAVAKLSQLSRIEYERVRYKAAKELGCRVSFLDRVIENIHEAIRLLKNDYHLRSFAREDGERLIRFRVDDSTVTHSWRVAKAEDIKTGEPAELLLLADGDFTVVRGVPCVKKPEPHSINPSI